MRNHQPGNPNATTNTATTITTGSLENQRAGGFTLIESLVALLVLALGLGFGLNAVIQGRVALDLLALQATLDETLDQTHEALRSRRTDVVKIATLGTAYIEPFTFKVKALPSLEQERDPGSDRLRATVSATAVADLFEIKFEARGRRGRLIRERTLKTQFFEPGLTAQLAAQ